jgi:hypothetical protein
MVMNTEFPIGTLISARRRELGMSPAELVRRAGYKRINSGLRRLNALCLGDLSGKTQFLVGGLPGALEFSPDRMNEAIVATAYQLAEAECARAVEAERMNRDRLLTGIGTIIPRSLEEFRIESPERHQR